MPTIGSVDAPERLAVAVIRAWLERNGAHTLKIRITTESDAAAPTRTIGVASDIDAACAIVREWLEAFAREPPAPASRDDRREAR